MKLLLRSILFLAIASFGPLAVAQPTAWTNIGPDNNFDNGANWTTATGSGIVPGPSNLVGVFPGFTTLPNTNHTLILVEQGGSPDITIAAASSESIQGLLISSNFDTITVPSGILNLFFNGGGTLTVGSQGVAIVGGTTVNYLGNLGIVSSDLTVGSDNNPIDSSQTTGTGTLNLSAGTVHMDSATPTSFVVGQGVSGAVVQNTGSVVTAGETFTVGSGGGIGTYTVNSGATLNMGTPGTPLSADYFSEIGSGVGSNGTLNISGGTLTAVNPHTTFTVGAVGAGTINESGAATVTIGGGANSSFFLGEGGGTGLYDLSSGSLGLTSGTVALGEGNGSTGNLIQTGGVLIVGPATSLIIGDGGTGQYTLTGGTAVFQSGFLAGNSGAGTINQSGGALTADQAVQLGQGGGTGIYNLSGGSAIFNGGVTVSGGSSLNISGGAFSLGTGNNSLAVLTGGVIKQTGGLVTIDTTQGQVIDLSSVGSSYTLSGGVLKIGDGSLLGTSGTGMLNLGGGTLQITSVTLGSFTDPLDGLLTGVSTIDAVTTPGITNVTMAGGLRGTGGITFEGGAATHFNFTGVNSYQGPTTIASGILDANAADINNAVAHTFSSALDIGSTATLNLTLAHGGLAYGGALGGSGALNINFNTAGDPFVVGNASTYGGPITLGANGTSGKLQVYNGTFGQISDNNTASAVIIGGTPLTPFPTSVTAPPAGVVTFGTSTYTGPTTINTGFTLNATHLTSAVTNNGSFFALSANSVVNNGIMGLSQSSAAGSTFAINGDFMQPAGSTLAERLNGAAADTYTATTAELSGTIAVSGATVSSSAPTTYQIVKTTASLTTGVLNTPGGLHTSNGFLLSTSLAIDPNPKFLDLIATANPIMGQTPNQNALAAVLNANPNNPVFTLINANPNLTAANAPAILQSLIPEQLQYARFIAFENSTFLVGRMNGVDADLRGGYGGLDTSAINIVAPGFDSGLGRSLGSLLAYNAPAYHSNAPNGVNYYPGGGGESGGDDTPAASSSAAPTWDSSNQVISDSPNPYLATTNPAGPETPRLSEFISGDAILADLNQNGNNSLPKTSYKAGDATAGVGFRMTSHLTAGVLFDYNHTDAKTDSSGSKTTIDTYSPGLFATYFDHGFYANGLFSFGYNNYSNSRTVSLFNETASSSPHGEQYVGDLDVGYDFHPDKAWVWGPTLGVTYTHLNIDSFSETGAPGADLDVNSQSADSLRSRLGGHVVFQTNTGDVLLQPNFTAMWQHEYMDNSSGITSSFADSSVSPFTIQTAAPSRDSALIGVGLTATLNNSMALYLNYMADVGFGDYLAQSVVGGLKARF